PDVPPISSGSLPISTRALNGTRKPSRSLQLGVITAVVVVLRIVKVTLVALLVISVDVVIVFTEVLIVAVLNMGDEEVWIGDDESRINLPACRQIEGAQEIAAGGAVPLHLSGADRPANHAQPSPVAENAIEIVAQGHQGVGVLIDRVLRQIGCGD